MLSILDIFGVDKETLEWQDLSLCQSLDTPDHFFDDYEDNPSIAKVVDSMCLSCPVIKQCGLAGVQGDEHGVWGGVYLISGKADRARNSHKTEAVWNELRQRLS